MKQYFIGFNKRSEDLILELLNVGASLMFYHHFITRDLNRRFGFYDGEWMLYNCEGDRDIEKIKSFLEIKISIDKSFKFEIVPVK